MDQCNKAEKCCQATDASSLQGQESQCQYRVDDIPFTMKAIPAVKEGSIGNDDQEDNKEHTISLTAYLIGETAVTQELWHAVMEDNPSFFDNTGTKEEYDTAPAAGEASERRPVENVNWFDSIVFCNELTKKVSHAADCVYYADKNYKKAYTKEDAEKQKQPYPNMNRTGFRLPTEAEWEWAAQGGEKRQQYAGTDAESELNAFAWYESNSKHKTHEVKKKQPNAYGLYDMSGNIAEWCWDYYWESTPKGGLDPVGPDESWSRAWNGPRRVLRGGWWESNAEKAKCCYRFHRNPSDLRILPGDHLGLRVVCRGPKMPDSGNAAGFSIGYELNGGTNDPANPASYTEKTAAITLKPATKEGHLFMGWYENADFTGDEVAKIAKGSIGSKTLYAKFSEQTVYTVDKVSFTVITVPEVHKGLVGDNSYRDNAEHRVDLAAYRIGETAVTQELWQAVMDNNPSFFQDSPASGEAQEKRPVENVTWVECIAFCNELTKKIQGAAECVYYSDEKLTTVYTKDDAAAQKLPYPDMNKKGFRLPTEDEWEWAAQDGHKRYKYAGRMDIKTTVKDYAWYGTTTKRITHEVKKKLPNGFGLYDMNGNVAEWCWDWHRRDQTHQGYRGIKNRFLEDKADLRTVRGGSWYFGATNCDCARRDSGMQFNSQSYIGLRVVCRADCT